MPVWGLCQGSRGLGQLKEIAVWTLLSKAPLLQALSGWGILRLGEG